jgi:hypothetical protein
MTLMGPSWSLGFRCMPRDVAGQRPEQRVDRLVPQAVASPGDESRPVPNEQRQVPVGSPM